MGSFARREGGNEGDCIWREEKFREKRKII